ncbi:hypothetical protein CPC08DRAFT_738376 [Agrocybe pediades]|nr:hypothetical protein CPC08DRAFT_738376 [Agrocybe pediades]
MHHSFFTDGHVFKGTSVTGKALFDIMNRVRVIFYSAVAGDSAANVCAARIGLNKLYLWILNIYDPCHNLNLYMKDVGKLFKDLLSIVSGVANSFSKSNYGTYHLDAQRKIDGIQHGITNPMDTRFLSSYTQVVSVHNCMNSMRRCVESGALKFDTKATKKLEPYISGGPQFHHFMANMSGFIKLLESGANSIETLKGQNTTCANVFYVWVCIAYSLEQVLSNPTIGLMARRREVITIYNHRFS